MKKIIVITTGGTIACRSGENGLSPDKKGSELFGETAFPCEYDICDLYSIDSTELSPDRLRELHGAVTRLLPGYDGAVILHGTDTMAYTGAFLALTIGESKPIVLTGSMLSADEDGSDAPDNLRFAAETACRDDIRGVWLAFCERLIHGANIVKVSSREKDAFRAYSGSVFVPRGELRVPDNDRFPAVIKLTPFTREADLDIGENSCGAVIETYGAGGVPKRLLPALRALADRIPVIVTTPCLGGTELSRYEVGRRALDAGALDIGAVSTEFAAIYLWLRQ